MEHKIIPLSTKEKARSSSDIPFFFKDQKNLEIFLLYIGKSTAGLRKIMQDIAVLYKQAPGSLLMNEPKVSLLCRSTNSEIQAIYRKMLHDGFCAEIGEMVLFSNKHIKDEFEARSFSSGLEGQIMSWTHSRALEFFPPAELYTYKYDVVQLIDLEKIDLFEPLSVAHLSLVELVFSKTEALPSILVPYNSLPDVLELSIKNLIKVLLQISDLDKSRTGLHRTVIETLLPRLPEKLKDEVNQQCSRTADIQQQAKIILENYFEYAKKTKNPVGELLCNQTLLDSLNDPALPELYVLNFRLSRALFMKLVRYEYIPMDISFEKILYDILERTQRPLTATELQAQFKVDLKMALQGKETNISAERYGKIQELFIKQYALNTEKHLAQVLVVRIRLSQPEQQYYLFWKQVPAYLNLKAQESVHEVKRILAQRFMAKLDSNDLNAQYLTAENMDRLIRETILQKHFELFWTLIKDQSVVERVLAGQGQVPLLVKQLMQGQSSLVNLYQIEAQELFVTAIRTLLMDHTNVFVRLVKFLQYYWRWFFLKQKLTVADTPKTTSVKRDSASLETAEVLFLEDMPEAYRSVTQDKLDMVFAGIPRFDFGREGLDKNITATVNYTYAEYKKRSRRLSTVMIESLVEKIVEHEEKRVILKDPTLVKNVNLHEYIKLRTEKALRDIAKPR